MIYLDIETLDFFQDAHIKALPRPVQLLAMRFGMATTYDERTTTWTQYWPGKAVPLDGVERLAGDAVLEWLWRSLMGQTVLGWNIFDFDLPFLMLHLKAEGQDAGEQWLDPMQVIDLMDLCRRASKAFGRERWYKLQDVSMATLGRGKGGDGQQAAQDLASGDPERVAAAAAYCRQDVQLVVDLFAAARDTGLLLPARPARGEIGDLRLWLTGSGTIRDVRLAELPRTRDV